MAGYDHPALSFRASLRAEPPLLPRPTRPAAFAVMAVCAAVTAVIGVLVAHASRPDSLDRAVDSWIRAELGGHSRALVYVQDLGQPIQVAVMTLAIVVWCLAARRLHGALLAVISMPITIALTELVLKPLVDRKLNVTWVVYPSGHTGRVFALAAIVAVLLLDPAGGGLDRPARIAVAVAGVLIGCAVAVAMIGLNFHYFTDTIGGAALGIGVVIATAFLLDRRTRR